MNELERERERILAEYRRRDRNIPAQRYSPRNPAERLALQGRERMARRLLQAQQLEPSSLWRCLEVGVGRGGWSAEVQSWGVAVNKTFGVDIDLRRLLSIRRSALQTHCLLADGGQLPLVTSAFHLVVVSTLFSSVLDDSVASQIAAEIERVLHPQGCLLWYDFAWNNPSNPQVRGVGRRQVARLFPSLGGPVRSVTLAPPIARRLARWPSIGEHLARALTKLPFLRTHLVGVLRPTGGRAID